MKKARSVAATLAVYAALVTGASAQQPPATVTIFENVRIFDGKNPALSAPSNVLVRGNIIERIATTPIPVDRPADTHVIAGGGRVLMPGLSDVHWHAMLVRPTPAQMLSSDIGYTTLLRRRGSHRHADARVYDRQGHGRSRLRAQARH